MKARTETDEQRRRQNRAARIRRKRLDGKPVSDIEREWLRQHEARVAEHWHPRKLPTVAAGVVIDEVCARFGIARAVLVGDRRGGLGAEIARTVAVLALHELGASMSVIGADLNRTTPAIHRIIRRVGDDRRTFIDREVRAVLAALRHGSTKAVGQVVTMTVTVVVGDPLWCELDRIAEDREISEVSIQHSTHRTRRDRLALDGVAVE